MQVTGLWCVGSWRRAAFARSTPPAANWSPFASQTWACSKHGKRTLEDGLSAYSVFNPGHVRLHGTLTAEDLQSQMSGLIPRPGGGDDGIDEALERQAEAQEAAELQAAMEASLRDL